MLIVKGLKLTLLFFFLACLRYFCFVKLRREKKQGLLHYSLLFLELTQSKKVEQKFVTTFQNFLTEKLSSNFRRSGLPGRLTAQGGLDVKFFLLSLSLH